MPRPPILPAIAWPDIFASGAGFDEWLSKPADDDEANKCEAMLREVSELPLDASVAGFLRALPRTVHVIVIAEPWCGDVVRHVPVLERMARETEKLRTAYITRQQHPDVFTRYLTNGGEAIPKFVFLSEAWTECGNWGPMPTEARKIIARGNGAGDVGAARKRVTTFYESDPRRTVVVEELAELLAIATCDAP
ncbi:MAG: thioredoxin family protein [Sumerlaeia bacterium]